MLSARGLRRVNFSLSLPLPSSSWLMSTQLLSLSALFQWLSCASASSTPAEGVSRWQDSPSVPESPGADVQVPATHEVAAVAEPAPCPDAADATGRAPHLLLCVWKMGSPVLGPPCQTSHPRGRRIWLS